MPTINNVTRMLDSRKVPYLAFDLPVEKIGAENTAELLGVPAHQVFKTIVVKREKGKSILAIIPGDHEVDLKMLASALNEKKVLLPTQREAETLTGLQAGGISPLALVQKGFTVILDSAATEFDEIHISGGQRGLNIRLGVQDLIRLTSARLAKVSKPTEISDETDLTP